MYKATLSVEAVTPIFMYGAVNHPEIRAPEIKGLMRWWFRAIMGGLVPLRNLKTLEAEHFGSTNRKSEVNIYVSTTARATVFNIYGGYGLKYLWFSLFQQSKTLRKRYNRQLMYYPSRTRFKVEIRTSNYESFKVALGSLWALVYLGGIGARMRRGAGSLTIRDFSSSAKVPYSFVLLETNANGIKNFIETNLKKIFGAFNKLSRNNVITQRYPRDDSMNFAVLSKSSAKIFLLNNNYNSWKDALNDVGIKYKRFRGTIKPTGNRYVFGLPVSTKKYSSLRQASPLMFGVIETSRNKYFVRIIKFYTSIHPRFERNIAFLREKLDQFDRQLEGELKIDIPSS